jgi:hypothetical protein
MAGVNDLVAFGFGSWSTVAKVPTWGFGIGSVVQTGGIECRVTNTSPEYRLLDTSPSYRAENTSPEFRVIEV